ncbi:hypothetical protein F5X68DRAFT_250276 [Plectosphaerella plurivora]|uniref:MYND-type domain-containing protein n=1 Tax=Plectosphaerella plurivora TaxID=936078 RepID=A0A9P8UZE1_9PEZI|nr:hypothetical protein F5X68DRAFT_250276 [Plectosphaerella plurivora]
MDHHVRLPPNSDLVSDGIARVFIGKMPDHRGTQGIVIFDCNDPVMKSQPTKKSKKNKASPECKHNPPTSCFQGIGCRPAAKASFKQDDKVKTLCIMCPAKGTLRCTDCREARYCSQACLDLDKAVHIPLCDSFRNGFKDSNRPTKHHVRILVFHQDKSAPEFFWAKPRTTVQGKSLEIDDADLARNMTKNHLIHDTKSVNYGLGLSPIGHGINLYLIPTEVEQSPWNNNPIRTCKTQDLNKSIASLGPPGHTKPVYAHALAFAFESRNGTDLVKVQDMTFRDARHTIDSILQSSYNPVIVESEHFAKSRAVRLCPAIKSNKTNDPTLISLGVTPDQETEEVKVALPPAARAQYRPSFFPFSVGLRYWAKIPTPDEMSASDFESASFACWPARHSASYVEAIAHSDEEVAQGKGPFKYVRHFVLANTTTVVHGSGAAIPVEHFKAFSAWDDLWEKHINLGDSMPVWPAWTAEVLGEDRVEEMVALGQTRESFSLFWDAWKIKAGVPEMESPWDFEDRHKDETVFMRECGNWTWIKEGKTHADPKALMGDLKRLSLLRAVDKCAVDGERAIEVADHNGGRPVVVEGPSAEKDILIDLMTPGVMARVRVVFDRGNM